MGDCAENADAAGGLTIDLSADLNEALTVLAEAVERFAEAEAVAGVLSFRLNLVLDELVTNCVSYALQDVPEPQLRLCLRRCADALVAELEDNGPAFDPLTEAPTPDTTLELEERNIGGLGVYFVKQFAADAEYERVDGLNRIILRLNLEADDND